MRRIGFAVLTGVLTLTTVLWSVTPVSARPAEPQATYYLALGDSLSVGIQPLGKDGQNVETPVGYADQLYLRLKAADPSLRFKNLGCPGETTATMINGTDDPASPCLNRYPIGNQLDQAVEFLKNNKVSRMTIDVGANDALGDCVDPTGAVIPTCALTGINQVRENLGHILDKLGKNVDRRTIKSAGMTYYDPLLAVYPLNPAAARDSVGYTNLLNIVLAGRYFQHGFRVAPVGLAFQTNNFSIPPGSTVPVNVAVICRLTWMCSPPLPPNIHAKEAGYALIADTFAKTFRW